MQNAPNDPADQGDPFATIDEVSPSPPPQRFNATVSAVVDRFQPYFAVETPEVIRRLISAVHPFRRTFLAETSRPDLYGAFWIPLTAAFSLFALGSLSAKFERPADWKFNLLPFFCALVLLYAHLTISPLVYGRFVTVSAAAIACLLGYCLGGMVIIAFVCVVVGSRADFVVAAVGGAGCGLALFAKLGRDARGFVPNVVLATVHGFAVFGAERLLFRYPPTHTPV
jgi:hypothetical protein